MLPSRTLQLPHTTQDKAAPDSRWEAWLCLASTLATWEAQATLAGMQIGGPYLARGNNVTCGRSASVRCPRLSLDEEVSCLLQLILLRLPPGDRMGPEAPVFTPKQTVNGSRAAQVSLGPFYQGAPEA